MAWLSTAPEKQNSKIKTEPLARIKTKRERGEPILLPANPAPHVTDWLMEIGPTMPGAMGEGPIGWQDMTAWQELTGIDLFPWEARLIRDLSAVFLAQRHDAKKRDCPAPYTGEWDEIVSNRDHVAAQVKAAFSGLKKKGS